MEADVKLLFGAEEASFGNLSKDLEKIINEINSEPKLTTIKISLDLSAAEEKINALKEQLTELGNISLDDGSDRNTKKRKSSSRKYQDATKTIKDYYSIQKRIATSGFDVVKTENGYTSLSGKCEELAAAATDTQVAYNNLTNSIKEFPASQQTALIEMMTNAQKELNLSLETQSAKKSASQTLRDSTKAAREYYDTLLMLKKSSTDTQKDITFDKNTKLYSSVSGYNNEFADALNRTNAAFENAKTAIESLPIEQKEKALRALTDAQNKYNLSVESLKNNQSARDYKGSIEMEARIKKYIASNGKAYKEYRGAFDEMLRITSQEGGATSEELPDVKKRFLEIQIAAEAARKTGHTFFQMLKSGWERFGGWTLVTKSMMQAIRTIKEMISSVRELDTAMTELRKVTDLSEQAYNQYLKTAVKTSQEVGASLSDTVNATADFARLGYNISDATNLAEAALVYKNVGDGISGIGEASESIISTVKAFKEFGVSASNAMSIVDKFNKVGNEFAISSEGIGTALQKSASSLAAAGNSLDESIALIAGMNTVVQNPEVVGTALKTVSMYLRAAKAEAEAAGEETDGMAESVSKLREKLLALTKNRVDIMIDENTFKSTIQIMRELSEVWGDLPDIDTAAILELIGGKRNATAVTSLLTNFQDVEKALSASKHSYGSALAENEKVLDSIDGKISILHSKFEELSSNVINSGLVKFVVDIGNGLLSAVNELDRVHLLLPTIAASVATIYKIAKSKSDINGFFSAFSITDLNNIENIDESLSGASKFYKKVIEAKSALTKKNFGSVFDIIKDITTLVPDDSTTPKKISDTQKLLSLTLMQKSASGELTAEIIKQQIVESGLAESIDIETTAKLQNILASQKQKQTNVGVFQTIGSLAKAHPALTAAIVATTIAIGTAIILWDKFAITSEKAAERLAEAKNKLSDTESELSNAETEFNEVNSKLKEMQENISSIEAPTLADKSQLKELQSQNLELRAQIALLKEKKEINEKEVKKAEDDSWTAATTPATFNNVYDKETGKKVSKGKKILYSFTTVQNGKNGKGKISVFTQNVQNGTYMSEAKAASFYCQKLQELEKEKAAYDQRISQGIQLTNAEKAAYEDNIEVIGNMRASLTEIADTMSNSGENGKDLYYEIVFTLSEPTEQLTLFTEYLESLFGKEYDLSEVWNKYQEDDNSPLHHMIDTFKELYGIEFDGDLGAENLTNLTTIAKAAKAATDAETESLTKLQSKMEAIDKMSSAAKAMNGMMSSLKDGDNVSFSNLKDLSDALKELNISSDEYIEKILSAGNDQAKISNIFSEITNKMIDQKIATEGLTSADEELLTLWLEEIGVENAQIVAHDKLSDNIVVTQAEYNALCEVIGNTPKYTKLANDSLNIEGEALKDLGISAEDARMVIAAAQAGITGDTIEQVKIRLEALRTEAAAYEALFASNGGTTGDTASEQSRNARVNPNSDFAKKEAAAAQYVKYLNALSDLEKESNSVGISYSGSDKSGGSEGSGKDANLEAWNNLVEEKKHLLEMDQITQEEYYDWLAKSYKGHLSDTKKYSSELRSIEEELYNWEKEKIQSSIDDQTAILDNQRANGLISDEEYFKKLNQMYDDGYSDLQKAVSEKGLYGVDSTERLQAETEFINKVKEAHTSAYDAEVKQLERALHQKKITEEQYLFEMTRLYKEYYAGQEMYAEEAADAEQELYDLRVELVEKWANAAKDTIDAIAEATEGAVSAIKELIEGCIDANEENFNSEKALLDHALAMNYISEEEYYKSLDALTKKYFKAKNVYTEQYWENQEELYDHEQSMLEDSASAIEDIHAKVVDMIKSELEEAIDSIEETKDKYLDLIEIRKDALSDLQDEEDYEKERSEKLATVAELQRQLNALAYDTSAAGIRKYKEVQAQLKAAQDDLGELERKRAYDEMNKQLDKESDSAEDNYDSEKEKLEKMLDDNEYLVNEAWKRMDGMPQELFEQLDEYAKKHSTSIKDDLTDAWKAATAGVKEYGDALNAYLGYNNIIGSIGKPGMSDDEYKDFEKYVKKDIVESWVGVGIKFGSSMTEVITSLMSNFAGIIDSIFDTPLTHLMVLGAGAISSIANSGASILGSLFDIIGKFASGTSYVPRTGIYNTDERGEELKLVKNPSRGNYTLLTAGSKVIPADKAELFTRILNNPGQMAKLLFGNRLGALRALPNDSGISAIRNSNASIVNNNVFEIHSSDPEGVANEIRRIMPEIAKYTIGSIVNGVGNAGVKRKVQKLC